MLITNFRLTTPVFRYDSLVTFSTPRLPTVFENALLRMHTRISPTSPFYAVPLDALFQEVLGVPEADKLVLPALHKLLELQIFTSPLDNSSLSNLALRDLTLTARGAEMFRQERLPGRVVEETVRHDYDPIQRELIRGRGLLRDPLSITVPAALFESVYPQSLLHESLPQEGYSWWSKSTEIESLTCASAQTLWREHTAELWLTEGGALTVQVEAQALQQYLSRAGSELLTDTIIRPLLGTSPIAAEALGSEDWETVRAHVTELIPLAGAAGRIALEPGRVHALRHVPELYKPPAEAPERSVVILFDPAWESGAVQWNSRRDGAIISVPQAMPVAGCIHADSEGKHLFAATFRLGVNDDRCVVPVAFRCTDSKAAQALTMARERAEAVITASGCAEDLQLLALWQPLEPVWTAIYGHVASLATPLGARVDELKQARDRLLALGKAKGLPGWENDIVSLVAAYVAEMTEAPTVEHAKYLTQVLAKVGIKSADLLEPVAAAVAGRLPEPQGIAELERSYGVLKAFGSLGKLPFPSRQYNESVLRDCFTRFPEDGFEAFFKERNLFESAVRSLKVEEKNIKRFLRRDELLTFSAEDEYQKTLKTIRPRELQECCSKWQQNWQLLQQLLPDLDGLAAGTPLERLHENMTAYGLFLSKLENHIAPQFRNIFVVDTNVFLDNPDLLDHFTANDLLLVSKVVLDELDNHKHRAETGEAAARAIRALRDYTRPNLRYESADLSLLPDEYRRSPDNMILSVAVRFNSSQTVLLTADNGLALKAKAEDVRTMRLAELLKGRAGRSSGKASGKTARK